MYSKHLTTFLVAVFSAFALAQIDQLPECAQKCVEQFTSGSSIGGCAAIDAKCICSSPDFLAGIECCVAGVCNADDQQKTVNFATSFCRISGVTNLPQTATCSSSSGSSSATAAASGSSTNSTSTTTTSSSASSSSSSSQATNAAALAIHEGLIGAGMLGAAAAVVVAML